MPITNKGWELHVKRLGVQKKGSLKRTYGDYQVYIDGKAEGVFPATCAKRSAQRQ